MPRVIKREASQKMDAEGRTRDDYTYVAIPKELRGAIEAALREDSGKYGYRDFSSFCKNWMGYFVEKWELSHHIIEAKDYATNQVLVGGQKFAQPYSKKDQCECACHPALEVLARIQGNMNKEVGKLELKK